MSNPKERRRAALQKIEARYASALERPDSIKTGEVQPWKKEKRGYQLTRETSFRRQRAIDVLKGDDSPTARRLVENMQSVKRGRREGGKVGGGYLVPRGEKTLQAVKKFIEKRLAKGKSLRGIAGIMRRDPRSPLYGMSERHLRRVIEKADMK